MRELKAERIRDLNEEEILAKIQELTQELFNLRFRNSMRQLQNPVSIREKRRDVARLRTVLTEKRSARKQPAAEGGAKA
jgi:large subunit ribosomal protein L29